MSDDWVTSNLRFLHKYARKARAEGRKFLSEEFVHASREAGVPQPPDARNYGSIITQARSARIIRKAGYKRARSSHQNYKTLWEAA